MKDSVLSILSHLCCSNKTQLLIDFLNEHPEITQSELSVPTEFTENQLGGQYNFKNIVTKKHFKSTVDYLCYISILNNKMSVVDALLELNNEDENFFDYNTLEETFFCLCINQDIERVDKLINNGFNYKEQRIKTMKDKKFSYADFVLGASINRNNEEIIKYILGLDKFSPDDLWVSMFSITAFKRIDILKKLFSSKDEIHNYINRITTDESDEELINMLNELLQA